MIKLALRRNLIFPLQMLIFATLRELLSYLSSQFLEFNNSSIFTLLMFSGEFLGGLIFHLLQKRFLSQNKKRNELEFVNIRLVKGKENLAKDNKAKIIFIIFSLSFYDFEQSLLTIGIYKFTTLSITLEARFEGVFTIYIALFYHYLLKKPLLKHQKFSLKVIGICLLIIIITEIIFQEINIFLSYGQFFLTLLIILFIQFLGASIHIVEKYLFEYKNLSPFLVLMLEGLFGFILTLIYCLFYGSFIDIIKFYKINSTSKITFLIITFILYIILSGGKNLFRVVTTKIFNPVATSFMDYILNPLFIILYFLTLNDFTINEKRNFAYFILNLIIAFVISFCGGVFNEFLILFCCQLERDTHNQITSRSIIETPIGKLNEDDDDNRNDSLILESGKSKYIMQMEELNKFSLES